MTFKDRSKNPSGMKRNALDNFSVETVEGKKRPVGRSLSTDDVRKSNPARALELAAFTAEKEIERIAVGRSENGYLSPDDAKELITLGDFFARHLVPIREALEEQRGEGIKALSDMELRERYLAKAKQLEKMKPEDIRVAEAQKQLREAEERRMMEEAPKAPEKKSLGDGLLSLVPTPSPPPNPRVFNRCENSHEVHGLCQRKRGHGGLHIRSLKTWETEPL